MFRWPVQDGDIYRCPQCGSELGFMDDEENSLSCRESWYRCEDCDTIFHLTEHFKVEGEGEDAEVVCDGEGPVVKSIEWGMDDY